MNYIWALALLAGGAVGFGGGWACWQTQLELQRVKHKQTLDEAWEEIRRLRAQVASIVGAEPHGVKPITQGNLPATPSGNTPEQPRLVA